MTAPKVPAPSPSPGITMHDTCAPLGTPAELEVLENPSRNGELHALIKDAIDELAQASFAAGNAQTTNEIRHTHKEAQRARQHLESLLGTGLKIYVPVAYRVPDKTRTQRIDQGWLLAEDKKLLSFFDTEPETLYSIVVLGDTADSGDEDNTSESS